MATEVGSLLIKVQADVAQLSSDLEKIKGRVGSFARTTKTQLDPVSKAFTNLGTKIAGVATAYVTLGTAMRSVRWFAGMADQESKLASFSKMIGITTESLRELRYVAKLSDIEPGQLDSALQKMSRQVSEAAKGRGRAKKELDELGLSAAALNRVGPERMLYAILTALKEIPDEADRVRLSMHIFDADMLRMMEGGIAGIEETREGFSRLGSVSADYTEKMLAADRAIDDLGSALEGLGRSLANIGATGFTKIVNDLKDMIVAIKGLADEFGNADSAVSKWDAIFRKWGNFLNPFGIFGPGGAGEQYMSKMDPYIHTQTGFVGPIKPETPPDALAGLRKKKTLTALEEMQMRVAMMQVSGSGMRYAGGTELAGLEPKTAAYDLSDFQEYYKGVDAEMKRNAQQMADYWEHHLTTMEQVTVNIASGIADSFGTMFSAVIDGTMSMKEAFANFGQAVIANIAQIIAKMIAMYAIEQVIMAAAGVFGFKPDKILKGIGIKHIGGLITGADMPRYHMGGMIRPLGQDEVPIIAQAGERILPRGASGGTQAPKVEINLHNEGEALNPTKKSMRMDEGKLVVDLWLERMNSSPSERRRARRSLS